MRKSDSCAFVVALTCGTVFAQQRGAAPRFAIADVHVASPGTARTMRGGFYVGGRYELHHATIVDLIRTAWDVVDVIGGPAWVGEKRFDVVALAPRDSGNDRLRAMLRELLQERFGLAVHKDQKDYPAWDMAVAVGKKMLLKASEGAEPSGCNPVSNIGSLPGSQSEEHTIMIDGPNGQVIRLSSNEPITFQCRNITMPAFADALRYHLNMGGYLQGYPVVDQTGLRGTWNFDFKVSFRQTGLAMAGDVQAGATITLFEALEKQLGLKLLPSRVSLQVIAIDHVNEKPSPNLPEVAQELPPWDKFDVAVIKPVDPRLASRPGRGGRGNLTAPDGRLDLQNMTVRNLIVMAWALPGPDSVVSGPKSIDSNRWDIVAKAVAPQLVSGAMSFGNPFEPDGIRIMMQTLLRDRFKLKVHNDDREANGYALVAEKPKLKKASDPSIRPDCHEGPGPDGKDPRIANPDASRLVTCLNMTVAEFAAELKGRAAGYLGQFPPVVDVTGIEGRYDLTINFSIPINLRAGETAFPSTGVFPTGVGGDATEPSRAITLFQALEKQLGLKLEQREVPSQVLVVDHVADSPTEN